MLSSIFLIGWQVWNIGVCILYNSERVSDISALTVTKFACNQHFVNQQNLQTPSSALIVHPNYNTPDPTLAQNDDNNQYTVQNICHDDVINQIMDDGIRVKCTQNFLPQKDSVLVDVPIYVSHDGGQNYEKHDNMMRCGEVSSQSGDNFVIEAIMCNTCNYTDFIIRSSCFVSVSISSSHQQNNSENVDHNGSERKTDYSDFNLKIVLFTSLVILMALMLHELGKRSAMMRCNRVLISSQDWIMNKFTSLTKSISNYLQKLKNNLAEILEIVSWDSECKKKVNIEQTSKKDLYYWSNNADVIRVNNEIIDRREREVYLNTHSFLHPGRKKQKPIISSRGITKQKTGRAITKAK